MEPFPPPSHVRPCIRVGVQEGAHHAGYLQPHADIGEDEAFGQGDALDGDVKDGDGEQDDHQTEVHIVERVLEPAQVALMLHHPQPHLPISYDEEPKKVLLLNMLVCHRSLKSNVQLTPGTLC